MTLLYIAGPYRGKCEHDVVSNIRRAEQVALDLWERGYAVICPHMNTALLGGARNLPDQTWLDGDIEMLKRCDGVVVIGKWRLSAGTLSEITAACEHGIPIYYWEAEEHRSKLMAGKVQ